MNTKHFFITNRQILSEKDGEVVRADGKEQAQKSIRFGTFDLNDFDTEDEDSATKAFKLFSDTTSSSSLPNYANAESRGKGSGQFFEALYDATQSDNGGDILFFVHGFDTDLKKAGDNIAYLHQRYVDNPDSPIEHIVLFTWPGKDCNPPLHYKDDADDADDSGEPLYRALQMFEQFKEQFFENNGKVWDKKLNLMCHSMGHRVLKHLLLTIKNKPHYRSLDNLFQEILLVAANVTWDELNEGQAMDNVGDLCDRVHVYYHRGDQVLDIARIRLFAKQLGRYGSKYSKLLASNIFQVDTTYVEYYPDTKWFGKKFDHWYYYESPDAVADMVAVLKGQISAHTIDGRQSIGERHFVLK